MGSTTVSPNPQPPRLPIPPISSGDSSIGDPTINWLTEAVAESEAFLMAQPGFDQISASIDAIMSADELRTTCTSPNLRTAFPPPA
jgi:hypothetical protein